MAKVNSIVCTGCGAPIIVPKIYRRVLTCEYCGTSCVVEGITNNTEILDKENINSGIGFTCSKKSMNATLVNAMSYNNGYPLDIFEKAQIVSIEKYVAPCYLFACNSYATMTYDIGNTRQQNVVKKLGGEYYNKTETFVEYTHMSAIVTSDDLIVAAGNNENAEIIASVYANFDPSRLVDVEHLNIPVDADISGFEIPQMTAFNDKVKQVVDDILERKAKANLAGQDYRNLRIGDSSVNRDEVSRVYLSYYKVTYKYASKEYIIYVSGDGKTCYIGGSPVDNSRLAKLKELQDALKNIPSNHTVFMVLFVVSLLLSCPTAGLMLIPAFIFLFLYYRFKALWYDSAVEEAHNNVKNWYEQQHKVKTDFLESGKMLNGLDGEYWNSHTFKNASPTSFAGYNQRLKNKE